VGLFALFTADLRCVLLEFRSRLVDLLLITLAVAPDGSVLAGPVREREETLIADLDLRTVATARRHMDPVGHYHRPDIFRLSVDTSPRPAVTELNR
jgi:hypothetical protein